jgi:outer membrane immunogenic protein
MKNVAIGVIAAAALGIGQAATAADMPLKAVPQLPAPVDSWTGFYVGLGIGERSSVVDSSITTATTPTANLLALFCTAAAPCIPGEPLDNTAFRVSPYVGYNWQVGSQWLVGIEADYGWANRTRAISGMEYPGGNAPSFLATGLADSTYSVQTTWDASVRGRLGMLAAPNVLFYVTGGVAWLHAAQTSVCGSAPGSNCVPGGFVPAVITDSTTRVGWTIGGGLEAMVWGNWIARGEYRYGDFGTWSPSDVRTNTNPPFALNVTDAIRIRTNTVTLGLAYKFGGPVVAKY